MTATLSLDHEQAGIITDFRATLQKVFKKTLLRATTVSPLLFQLKTGMQNFTNVRCQIRISYIA